MRRLFGMDRKPQPRTCPDCKKKLADAEYERLPRDHQFRIHCSCGVILAWSYPGVWKRNHVLPLWEISGVAR